MIRLEAERNWNLNGGAATPNLAAEVTPIKNWLELEAGVSPFYTRNLTEWDTDLLFKKPWTISRKAEFMMGAGPEWVRLIENGKMTTPSLGSWRETSCSGPLANTISAGSSNQLTTTVLPEATSNPSV
jgi:hypothetical protein